MRQYVLPPSFDGGGKIEISGPDSKYILKVLRLGTGDSFPAVDRDGHRYLLEITEAGAESFTASCRGLQNGEPAPERSSGPEELILLQCLPKGKKLETIVRQAVEAGVSLIVPVESENSVAVIKEERSGRKTERLNKIAEEAAQQSGNPGVPEIVQPVKMSGLPELLENLGAGGVRLFFHQERLEKRSLHGYLNGSSGSVCILIGPEGGISPAETDFLLDSDFHPVYLGENVLRTETAAIYAIGAVKTILLEKNEWKTDIRE